MGALFENGDDLTQERANRAWIYGRLNHPAYDVNQVGTVTVDPKAVDGDDIVAATTTHYTAGAGITKAIVHRITLTNNDVDGHVCAVWLIQNGSTTGAARAVFFDTVHPGETVQLEGPWFLDPSDTIRSASTTAAANEVGMRVEVTELTGTTPGVTLIVDDGDALTTSKVAYYTCPASGVRHTTVEAITVCNTHSAAVTVTIEIRPSGGTAQNRQNILARSIPAGRSVVLGGFILEPGDAVYAMASTGAVVGFRVSPVEYTI